MMDPSSIDFADALRRARKIGWHRVAASLGVGEEWLRRRAQPGYASARNQRHSMAIEARRADRAPVAPRLPYVRFLDPKAQKVRT